jgi:uncharacterized protein with HEPN domain
MKDQPDSRFLELLSDIVLWGERVPALLGGMTFEQFEEDHRTHLAVWKCLEVVGEASGRILKIDPGIERKYPDLQVRAAYAMRNRLSHGYGGVDLSVLWTTAHNFLPPMVAAARTARQRSTVDGDPNRSSL